jgi:acylphosphatase
MNVYLFIITGKVQGVFYRKSIQQMASFGQIQGYVKNLDDGSVEVVAFLYDDQFEDFMNILKNGSPMSEVEDITYKILEEDDLLYDGFEVRE